ncbi:MAG TPA: SsrA-binding protein SmpB [Alphaproteobacteria bacterium]|jgi:SsrA-binding protein|nr:SsrA-binding protein SmpB [Alphaproteobacteria bacterium]
MAGKNKNAGKADANNKTVAQNRRARFDYFIEETLEAGIVLTGTEVKSLRAGQASINESYAGVQGSQIVLVNAYIPEYNKAHVKLQHEVRRPRQLLLHKNQMNKLIGAVQRKGTTLIPLSIYFNHRGIAKVELGIATGKKQHDKRETIKTRDWQREKSRLMREKG